MLEKTRGIVLHSVKYSENSLVVVIYTEGFGRQSYMVSGVHSKKSARARRMLQPLDLLELEVYMKTSREVQRIKEYKSLNPLSGIHSSITRTTIALFIAEVLFRCIKEEEKNPELFSYLTNSVEYLDLADSGIENFHLIFLVKLSKFLGFFPENNFNALNLHFNLLTGNFCPLVVSDRNILDLQESELIHKLMGTGFSESENLKLNGSLRSSLLEKLILYYQLHFEGFSQLKSHKVLQEVFTTAENTDNSGM